MTAGPVSPSATIELRGRPVAYRLQRTRRRRSIALLVDEQGLRVAAPQSAPQRDIDRLLETHADWVLRKLEDWQSKRPEPVLWRSGSRICYLGQRLVLDCASGIESPCLDRDRLLVGPPALTAQAMEKRVRRWLRSQALALFSERCGRFASDLGLAAPAVRLSSARTRWGSCSRDGDGGGRIRMNWRLIQMPMPWIDYVAAHEVAHLREMNHSKAFWLVVESLVAGCAGRRSAMRRDGHRFLLL